MSSQSIRFDRVCEDYLQQKCFRDDPQARMTPTEVLLTALGAAWCFANNLRAARKALASSGLVPYMLAESRLNRRWHRITGQDWRAIVTLLAQQDPEDTFLADSCPFAVCLNQWAKRRRLYQDAGGAYWGYCAAKEKYFYGLRAHLIVTPTGRPVDVLLWCGCSHDLTGLKEMQIHLPEGSRLIGEKAGTDDALKPGCRQTGRLLSCLCAGAFTSVNTTPSWPKRSVGQANASRRLLARWLPSYPIGFMR